jgi:hypothetical protein
MQVAITRRCPSARPLRQLIRKLDGDFRARGVKTLTSWALPNRTVMIIALLVKGLVPIRVTVHLNVVGALKKIHVC